MTYIGHQVNYMTTQLLAASLRSCVLASFSPLNLFRLMKERCLPPNTPVFVSPALPVADAPLDRDVLLVPAEERAATSITSLTLRWDDLDDVSEYTRAPMCFAVFNPCGHRKRPLLSMLKLQYVQNLWSNKVYIKYTIVQKHNSIQSFTFLMNKNYNPSPKIIHISNHFSKPI